MINSEIILLDLLLLSVIAIVFVVAWCVRQLNKEK